MALYFIWKNTDSRNMHVRVQNPAEIVRPEERVEHIVIPGRAGELTQVEGDDIYNSYIQTLSLSVDGAANVPAVERWLKGDGYVTFHVQPQREQRARIINSVTFTKLSRNLDVWQGDVQFYCEPLKRQINEGIIEITESGTVISNDGDVTAYPTITLNGTGAVSLTIGSKILTIPDLETGSVLDCSMQWLLEDGVPQAGAWSGTFPDLPVGESTLLFTGSIDSINIQLNQRYL